MGVPWLQWGDRQAILFDIAHRRYYFPGFVIWPQELEFLLLIMIALGLSLFLFTALFGRIWCGWACPQTLYVELFDSVGRLLFPSRYGKRSEKLWHKVTVHLVWILLSFVFTFHFVAYFAGARQMLSSLLEMGPGVFADYSWPYFLVVISFIFYFDMGIFREQMCIYTCPYARFQSVMLDRNSVVIAYDSHRGEPRRGSVAEEPEKTEAAEVKVETQKMDVAGEGDCTSCNMCVLVCPTGIDIREGLQVSCINCGHCIDACTHEMDRFDKKSLVNYSSLNYSEERIPTRFLRPRTVIYTTLMAVVFGFFTFLAVNRVPIHFSVMPDRSLKALRLPNGTVMNYYKFNVSNLTEQDTDVNISVEALKNGEAVSNLKLVNDSAFFHIKANGLLNNRLLVEGTVDPSLKESRTLTLRFVIHSSKHPDQKVERETLFHVPSN